MNKLLAWFWDVERKRLREWLACTALALALGLLCFFGVDVPWSRFASSVLRPAREMIWATEIHRPAMWMAHLWILATGLLVLSGGTLSRLQTCGLLASLAHILSRQLKDVLQVVVDRNWPESWGKETDIGSLIRNNTYEFTFGFGIEEELGSFPSGTTASVVSIVVVPWIQYPRLRLLYACLPLMTIISLLINNFHFISDTVGGFFIGASPGWLLLQLWEAPRRIVSSAVAPASEPAAAAAVPAQAAEVPIVAVSMALPEKSDGEIEEPAESASLLRPTSVLRNVANEVRAANSWLWHRDRVRLRWWMLAFCANAVVTAILYSAVDRPFALWAKDATDPGPWTPESSSQLVKLISVGMLILHSCFAMCALAVCSGVKPDAVLSCIALSSIAIIIARHGAFLAAIAVGRPSPKAFTDAKPNPSFLRDGLYTLEPFDGGSAYLSYPSLVGAGCASAVGVAMWMLPPRLWWWRLALAALPLCASLASAFTNTQFLSDEIAGLFIGFSTSRLLVELWMVRHAPKWDA
jgi:hypothetical protein